MRRQGKIEIRKNPPVGLILTTVPSSRQAKRLAEGLIGKQLAACCNVIPGLTSFFRWEGKKEESREALLLVKTVASRMTEALSYVRQHHPYELPELIVLFPKGVETSYLTWMIESCRSAGSR